MRHMDAFITLLIRILEVMFAVGVCGSAIVWLLTAAELITVITGDQESRPGEPPAGESTAV